MKRFFVILLLTTVVWVGVSMSEEREYAVDLRLQMTGYDTVRYAAVAADTILPLKVTLSGFNAFLLGLHPGMLRYRVPVDENHTAVAVSELMEPLRQSILGAKRVTSSVDSLRIQLALRASRTYRPMLDDVKFFFSEQYGLYGEPRITPAEVTLYGPAEVLAQIDGIHAMPAVWPNISASATYRIPLQPVWEQYADVHPSVKEIDVFLPVEAYVEKEYRVPIEVLGADTSVSLRLYPDYATVRAWVAQRDLQREPEMVVAIDYNQMLAGGGRLVPQLIQFPDYLRPRSIEPREVQCVVIK